MDKYKKPLLGLVVVVFIAVIAWTVMTVPEAPSTGDTPVTTGTTMTYDGNTISETKNGRTLWELTAEHIEMNADTQDLTLEKVTGKVYGADGREVTLQADKGIYTDKMKDITLTDNIAITSNDGMSLKCNELKWLGSDEILAAIGNVEAVKGDMRATGDRIESSDAFAKFKIIGHAHLARGGN